MDVKRWTKLYRVYLSFCYILTPLTFSNRIGEIGACFQNVKVISHKKVEETKSSLALRTGERMQRQRKNGSGSTKASLASAENEAAGRER